MGEPFFPEYGIKDQDGAIRYICKKIPDWHDRLRKLETEFGQHRKDFLATTVKVDQIHEAICGSIDSQKRGLFVRIEILERFRAFTCWALGTLYVATIGSLIAVLIKRLVKDGL